MIKRIKQKIKSSEFLVNSLTLLTGTTISQGILFGLSWLLARIYSPSDFGVLTIFTSIGGMLGIIATGRYELAIVIAKTKKDAFHLFVLSLFITVFLSVFFLIVFIVFNQQICNYYGSDRISTWLYFVPFSVFFTGIFLSLNAWFNREKRYKTMSIYKLYGAGFLAFFQVGFSYISKSSGLIIGNLVTRITENFIYTISFFRITKKEDRDFSTIKISKIKQLARQYKDFPMVNSLHAFSDMARDGVAIMLISKYFGEETVGFYALTLRALKTPLIFIGGAINRVFYEKSTEYKEKKVLYKQTISLLKKLFLIGIPIFVILFFVAEMFFKFYFGDEWSVSGTYAKIMTAVFFVNFITSPISTIPLLLDKQKTSFAINFIRSSLFVLIFLAGGLFNYSFYDTLIINAIVMTGFMVFYLSWIVYIVRKY